MKEKDNIESITEAADILGIKYGASMKEIKDAYRNLLNRWHPDKFGGDKQVCLDKTVRITEAYNILIEYCENYKFDFAEQTVKDKISETDPETFWNEKFGKDPMWGGPGYE